MPALRLRLGPLTHARERVTDVPVQPDVGYLVLAGSFFNPPARRTQIAATIPRVYKPPILGILWYNQLGTSGLLLYGGLVRGAAPNSFDGGESFLL